MIPSAKTVLGVVLGIGAGAGVTVLCASMIVPKVADARRAELGLPLVLKSLKPALIARRDLAPLTRISYDDLTRDDVPEQILPASVIRPGEVLSLHDQILTVPLKAGDLLSWSYFTRAAPGVEATDDDVFDACLLAIDASASGPKIERSNAEIRARLSKEAR